MSKRRNRKKKKFPIIPVIILLLLLSFFGKSNKQTEQDEPVSSQSTENIETEIPSEEASQTDESVSTEAVSEEAPASSEETENVSDGDFSITMLNVGQGLSLLMEADGEYAIYDGGPRESSSYVVAYLKQHNVASLKYMIASHYDEDHISGLTGVLATTAVETCICPDYTKDTKTYTSFKSKLDANGASVVHPAAGDQYDFGKGKITVLASENNAEEDNNRSIVVLVTYGKFKCMLTGDAETDTESHIISSGKTEDVDLYVAGHHGSSSSSSAAFISAISPEYVFISCGEGNSYGHPTERTLKTLKENGCQIFRSDIQGEVTCSSDGKTYSFSTDPTDDWTPGEKSEETEDTSSVSQSQVSSSNDAQNTSGYTYICNTKTMKIHRANCDSVNDMAESNKYYTNESVAQLEAEGYEPCKRCNP